jgi:shikimate dehydrogenase
VRQLAVSIPHKTAVLEHVDQVDERAARIGAVNTVTRDGDRLIGSNTDWTGALRALEREIDPKGVRAVVLGAGGAARAVVYGLLQRGARVTVLNRSESRAHELADALGAHGSGGLADLAKTPCDVLINTTSVGLAADESPVPGEAIPASSVVMDCVYDPTQTRLLRDAAERGARTIGGKWMLVHQAAEQLQLWTGSEAPLEVMAEAFDRA